MNDTRENTIPSTIHEPSYLEYILFPIFLFFFLSTLLLFELIQQIVKLTNPSLKTIDFCSLWFNKFVLYSLKVVGTRIEVTGQENLPETGPAVIISNHQSMFDISSIHVSCAKIRPRFVAKFELSKGIPGISTCLKLSKAALIDRSDPSQALPEIQRFGVFIKESKTSGVIFPEGTRARGSELKEFKKRGAISLLEQVTPAIVIPVCVENSWKLQARKYGPLPIGVTIRIKILESIPLNSPEDAKFVYRKVENLIKKSFGALN